MPEIRRLRVFAGPNGSGKTSLFQRFKERYDPGVFINPDDISLQIQTKGLIDLQMMGLTVSQRDLRAFSRTKEAQSLIQKASRNNLRLDFKVWDDFIVDATKKTHAYEASYAAAFIRYLLLNDGVSFSFETVLSHPSKIEIFKKAIAKGYRTYLYFVCTDNVEINISRVEDRVKKGGHYVAPEIVRDRYSKALINLFPAIPYVHRAYFFDNSGREMQMIAEIYKGCFLQSYVNCLPYWFKKYVHIHYSV